MSNVLWTDGFHLTLRSAKLKHNACEVGYLPGSFYPLTADECRSLAAALIAAADKKERETP